MPQLALQEQLHILHLLVRLQLLEVVGEVLEGVDHVKLLVFPLQLIPVHRHWPLEGSRDVRGQLD